MLHEGKDAALLKVYCCDALCSDTALYEKVVVSKQFVNSIMRTANGPQIPLIIAAGSPLGISQNTSGNMHKAQNLLTNKGFYLSQHGKTGGFSRHNTSNCDQASMGMGVIASESNVGDDEIDDNQLDSTLYLKVGLDPKGFSENIGINSAENKNRKHKMSGARLGMVKNAASWENA